MNEEMKSYVSQKVRSSIRSDTFKPTTNCGKASEAANQIVGLIRRNIINKTEEEMLILYKTLVRPTLDYCIPVWRPYLRKDIGHSSNEYKKDLRK